MADKLIMVVEDETDLRGFVEAVLGAEGYQVVGAGDGYEAIQEVAQHKPALILLDMRLPKMDGWQFAKELRARFNGSIPVVVMTALNARQIAREIGAKAYLQKPFDIDDLLKVVNSFSG
ncbi:MAG: response regulator transcription factor [Chloroflexi bacterium]|nr:response regulator transcription factor [Chloroflexota bacterium]